LTVLTCYTLPFVIVAALLKRRIEFLKSKILKPAVNFSMLSRPLVTKAKLPGPISLKFGMADLQKNWV